MSDKFRHLPNRKKAFAEALSLLMIAGAVSLAAAQTESNPAAGEQGNTTISEFRAADPEGLSADQLRAFAKDYVELIRATLGEIRSGYSTAKDDKDVVKTLCLDDKVRQVDAALQTATERQATLSEALEDGAQERARHEFTLIGVLTERVAVLVVEANQCIGEETEFTEDDESVLALEVDEFLPQINAEIIQIPPVLVIPPSVNSPVD